MGAFDCADPTIFRDRAVLSHRMDGSTSLLYKSLLARGQARQYANMSSSKATHPTAPLLAGLLNAWAKQSTWNQGHSIGIV